MKMNKTSKNNQMFNLSEGIMPKSLTNLPSSNIKNEHLFAQGEISLQHFITNSYSKCFKLLDRFWEEGLKLLKLTKKKCYENKSELSEYLTKEFSQIENLENFKMGNSASKERFEEVNLIQGRAKFDSFI